MFTNDSLLRSSSAVTFVVMDWAEKLKSASTTAIPTSGPSRWLDLELVVPARVHH